MPRHLLLTGCGTPRLQAPTVSDYELCGGRMNHLLADYASAGYVDYRRFMPLQENSCYADVTDFVWTARFISRIRALSSPTTSPLTMATDDAKDAPRFPMSSGSALSLEPPRSTRTGESFCRYRHLFACMLGFCLLACDSGPTYPRIADVSVPGTFALQLFDPAEASFTGAAQLNYCHGSNSEWGLRLRTPTYPGEEVTMTTQMGAIVVTVPMPLGDHRFTELAYGSQTYTIRHFRRELSGLPSEVGVPTTRGRVDVTESSLTTLRGRIDLTFTYYSDSASPPKVRRLRGSFWAVQDPLCEEMMQRAGMT